MKPSWTTDQQRVLDACHEFQQSADRLLKVELPALGGMTTALLEHIYRHPGTFIYISSRDPSYAFNNLLHTLQLNDEKILRCSQVNIRTADRDIYLLPFNYSFTDRLLQRLQSKPDETPATAILDKATISSIDTASVRVIKAAALASTQ